MKRLSAAIIAIIMTFSVFPVIPSYADTSVTERYDDFEGYDLGKSFAAASGLYRGFGNFSKSPYVTGTISFDGEKSLVSEQRCSTSASVKVLNFLQRDITKEDVGTTYKISFMIYPKKEAGVYISIGETPEACTKMSEDDLKLSTGTSFRVIMAGPDDKNYKYRQGANEKGTYKDFYAAWNEWTEINLYYTVEERFLDDGQTDDLSNPYINSFRIMQSDLDYSPNQGLADTFYIDNLSVTKAKAEVTHAFSSQAVYVRTEYLEGIDEEYARTYILEYDNDGKLIGAKVGEKVATRMPDHTMSSDILRYKRNSQDSVLYASVLTGDASTPAVTWTRLSDITSDYGFVTQEMAAERAKQMLNSSKATYTDAISSDTGFDKENSYFLPTDDVFYNTESTENNNAAYGTCRVDGKRVSVFRFDISSETTASVSDAYLRLYTKTITTPGIVEVYELLGDDWNEKSAYQALASTGERISSLNIDTKGVVYYFDISSYINKALKDKKSTISLMLKTSDANVAFESKDGVEKSFKPALVLEGRGLTEGEKKVSSFDYSNYIDVMKRKKTPSDAFEKTPTRVMDSITDYAQISKMPSLSKYGGWIDGGKYEATGFFYTKEIDGRWWIIDPLGYKMIYMGIASVNAIKNTDITASGFSERYGEGKNWIDSIPGEFREFGLNSVGAWADYPNLLKTSEGITPLNAVGYKKSFIATYDTVDDNMLNVFDPDFEVAADGYAKVHIAPYAESPYIIGWNTDNEPMANDEMLISYLTCNTNDDWNMYNYYTAWEWLKSRHGDNAGLDDVTDRDKMDWVEFVYDRYMNVCATAIRKYDKNHMIIGPKMDKPHQGAFRGLKCWVDIVGYDYYGNAWTADPLQIEQWYKWAGKPLINEEWYAKGMDACTEESSLTNEAGVGFTVQTQDERGHYYQSFVLTMLESKVFVGWHWFKYMDNDPSNPNQDVSNIDANKGIITREYEYYTTLLSHMNDINMNAYNLTQYFDE